MVRIPHRVLIVSLAALLSACGGGGGGGGGGDGGSITPPGPGPGPGPEPSACSTISGGLTQLNYDLSSGCTACNFSNPRNADDGDLSTFATATFQITGSGDLPIEVTAQPGITFPAGSRAAVVVNFLEASGSSNMADTITTFLAGTLQEQQSFGGGGNVYGDSNVHRQGFVTTKAFDSIRIDLRRSLPGSTKNVQIYEFCSDSTQS